METGERQLSSPPAEDEAHLTAFVADHLPVCIGYVDAARRYRYVNARYEKLFARPRNTILGRTVAQIVGPDNYRAVEPYVTKALAGEPCAFEHSARYPSQGLRHAHFEYLPHKLETGEIAGYFVLVMDITEIHEMRRTLERQNEQLLRTQRELERLALHDPLTGLGNRRLFQQQMEHALLLAKRTGRAIGLLLIDLDGFKRINDTAGHDAGDAVLKETAERLTQGCRRADTIARLGGDEFVVLMETGATVEGAGILADRIHASLERPIRHDGASFDIAVSIGIAISDTADKGPHDLLRAADAAMYRAKASGGGTETSPA